MHNATINGGLLQGVYREEGTQAGSLEKKRLSLKKLPA